MQIHAFLIYSLFIVVILLIAITNARLSTIVEFLTEYLKNDIECKKKEIAAIQDSLPASPYCIHGELRTQECIKCKAYLGLK